MIAPLFAVALQLQRLGSGPIATAADLEHAHVRIDADHVALETLLGKLGAALGVPVASLRGESPDVIASVIANDVEVGPLLAMLQKGEPVLLGSGPGAPAFTAEYFPVVQLAAQSDPGGERCRLAPVSDTTALEVVAGWLRPPAPTQALSETRVSLDLQACPIERLASAIHDAFGVRIVVAPAIAGLRVTARATDSSTSLFFESVRRAAGVKIEFSVAGITTVAFSDSPHRVYRDFGLQTAVPRESTLQTPDAATAAALEPVIAPYLSHFGTIERRGRELHVIDDEDNLLRIQHLSDAYRNRGWRP